MKCKARDIAARALACNAPVDDAMCVLSQALEALQSELSIFAQAAQNGCGNQPEFVTGLWALSTRAEALENFSDTFLDVEFSDLEGGAS